MKLGGLEARVEWLEARRPQKPMRIQRLIVEKAEAEATGRYEQEAGIDPADFLILRVIVDPVGTA